MKSATTTATIVSAILLATIAMLSPAFAQTTQATYTANLTYSSIQVTYPSEVMPGDTVTVNVQVTPKNNVFLQKLTATIYYSDETGLHQLTSETLADNSNLAKNYNYGYGYSKSYATSSFSKSFQVTVPNDAPRTSLVALFSETAQSINYNYSYYYSYPYYYYYGYPYNSTYYSCGYYHCYYSYSYPAYYAYYPSYSYPSMSTDTAIAPLSYIKASTPEFASLQSQYQSLQQQLQQSQAQNQELQNTISSQSATINQLNQRLASSSNTTQTYQGLAVVLGVLAAVFAGIAAFRGRSKQQVIKSETTETKRTQ